MGNCGRMKNPMMFKIIPMYYADAIIVAEEEKPSAKALHVH
jgi:hypothetical protein